uniref:Exocyst complex component 5 n=1 Tax=Molossus molossus TaxID=27622 RepID=A0A7J8JT21_MOLMO|nr:exocyst complex component 5 [Molossus molossus]
MGKPFYPKKWWLIFYKKPNKPLKDVIGSLTLLIYQGMPLEFLPFLWNFYVLSILIMLWKQDLLEFLLQILGMQISIFWMLCSRPILFFIFLTSSLMTTSCH